MRLAVISDDLTGASDCGAQLVPYGLNVVVSVKNDRIKRQNDTVIFNTDSRSLSKEEAYKKVHELASILAAEKFDVIYKKIDSTMRGNIGIELNALFEALCPDFIVIAPGYPKNDRIIANGLHYLNGKLLHETEVAKDPKTPVLESNITKMIKQQAGRRVGHINKEVLRSGIDDICKALQKYKQEGVSYITVDSVEELNFEVLLHAINLMNYKTVYCGSSGLIAHIPKLFQLKVKEKKSFMLNEPILPALFVVGSVSKIGRTQLDYLLNNEQIEGIECNPINLLSGESRAQEELNSIKNRAVEAIRTQKNVVLFSSDKVEETQRVGIDRGLTLVEISNIISKTIGNIAVQIIRECQVKRLFLTGGDTAQQVLEHLEIEYFHLLDEIESGIPIGRLDNSGIIAVTKAGNFGNEYTMSTVLKKLNGTDQQQLIAE
ncbi:four-carbon acid sugar kinase family protein [Niallia taxi]|uniref:four-carbon acid sugar kinase family protein n=1 Tax=Niallia taxi TaxID=2499688 RepID=UPI003D2E37E9